MTKDQLQAELKAKVKPGIKPSQLRKSKSLSSIPKAPPLPKTELVRSKSAQELEPTNSKIEQLETKISTLELKLEVSQREIDGLTVESKAFQQQLTEKELEKQALQKQLAQKQNSQALDQALTKRHQNLKDWFIQYQKTKSLDQELSENIEEASSELENQDQTITQLRTENSKLKQTNSQLSQDLSLAQRLAELRKEPLALNPDAWPSLPSFSWITLALTALTLWFLIKPNHD